MLYPNHLLIFDGVCVLCNRTVQFILKHDKTRKFRYTTRQSEFANKLLSNYSPEYEQTDSVLYLRYEKLLTKSSAAIEIARTLGGIWKLWIVFYVFPKFFRDFLYDFIARNRYKWFGKKEYCSMPSPETADLFIE